MTGKVLLRNRGTNVLRIDGLEPVPIDAVFEVDARTAVLLRRLPASMATVEDVEPEPVAQPAARPRRRIVGMQAGAR